MKYLKILKINISDWVYDASKKEYYITKQLESASDIIAGIYKILNPESETRKDENVEKVDLNYQYDLDPGNPTVKIFSLHLFDGSIAYLHDIDNKANQELFSEDDWVLNTTTGEYEINTAYTGYVVDIFEEKDGILIPVEVNSIVKKQNSIKIASIHKFAGSVLYVR